MVIDQLGDYKEKWDITIFDIHGSVKLQAHKIKDKLYVIDTQEYKPGMYIVKIQKGGKCYRERLIVR